MKDNNSKETLPTTSAKRKRRRLYHPLPESASEHTKHPDQAKESDRTEVSRKINGYSETYDSAVRIVKKYSRYSSTIGLVPIPFAEMVILFGLQQKMLRKLCKHYNVSFSADLGKGLIASLVSGLNMGLLGGSILKAVPFIGLSVAVATSATLSMALTYGVGIVFVKHFESGGTLLDFNVKKRTSLTSE